VAFLEDVTVDAGGEQLGVPGRAECGTPLSLGSPST
jgi:hypothetical protein